MELRATHLTKLTLSIPDVKYAYFKSVYCSILGIYHTSKTQRRVCIVIWSIPQEWPWGLDCLHLKVKLFLNCLLTLVQCCMGRDQEKRSTWKIMRKLKAQFKPKLGTQNCPYYLEDISWPEWVTAEGSDVIDMKENVWEKCDFYQ